MIKNIDMDTKELREQFEKETGIKYHEVVNGDIPHGKLMYALWLEQKVIELTQSQQTVSDEEISIKVKDKIKELDLVKTHLAYYKLGFENCAEWMRDIFQAQTNEGEYWYLKGYEDRAKLSNLIFDETSKQHALTQFKALQNTNKDG